MAFDYPVFLNLTQVAVLVVGGGPVALRKATGLAKAGAIVTVIAPDVADGIEAVAHQIEKRPYRRGDIAGYKLVITATNDPVVNALVASDAKSHGVWVNSADDPDNCSFILPAVARRGFVTVAVSTGGSSPALAQRLRTDIASIHLTEIVETVAIELDRQRADIRAAGTSTEDIDWDDRINAALRAAKDSNYEL
ncbi:MAG: bifunctional precorrin-2 dehydrogenase/sirohydrochlorin ferrochelatase [Acidimicrobiaceae bacterium]|nr:bifunctional precorrin-2 dehydrogenase/sirohydrochlorin ferrochelatase [Acidimicrobiaceae bacterium]